MLLTAMRIRRQRAIVRAFGRAGALAAEHARSAEELDLRVDFAWQQLASLAVLRSPVSGRWFLDEANWRQLCRRRCAVILAVFAGLLLVLLFAYSMRWR